MRRALLSILLLLSLGACSDHSSAASYKNPLDRIVVQLGLGTVFQPCFRRIDAHSRGFIGDDACFRFDPPTRMRGIWIYEFEGSEFFPNATNVPKDWNSSLEPIWLDYSRPEPLLGGWDGSRQAFAIEFVGRRATFPGHYGHMGVSRHMVLVDRLLSVKRVPLPNDPE